MNYTFIYNILMEHVNMIIDKKFFKQENISKNSISVSAFTAKVESKILFEDSSLKISKGIYGLIGPNGCGKSTLLLLMKHNMIPINPEWKVLYLEQELEETDDTPFNIVMKANDVLTSLKNRREYLNNIIDDDTIDDITDFIEELNEVEELILSYQLDKTEAQVKKILAGLGFNETTMNNPYNTFSGGWKMRVSLARALFIQPDVLLMDEPTNHLDLEATIWLTDYLNNYNKNKIVMLVTHNIGFLNNVTDYTLNIENNKIVTYKGNYYSFKKNFMNKKKEIQKNWDKFQKKVKTLKKKKGLKNKDIEEMMKKENIVKPDPEKNSKFNFYDYSTDDTNIVTIDKLSFGYNDNNIFEDINFGIQASSKIILVGKNGCGKSTLLKLITGQIDNNMVKCSSGIRIGVYDQHFESSLPLEMTPVEYLSQYVPSDLNGDPKFISRNYLGKVRLEASAHLKKMSELSGGMKARVALAKLIFDRPHLLIMDEPTNHLDIETVECLIEALNDFSGAFMVITHETHLIEELEDIIDLFLIENKKVIKYNGTIDDYRNKIIDELI